MTKTAFLGVLAVAKYALAAALLGGLVACGGGGAKGSDSGSGGGPTDPTTNVASIALKPSQASVKSDNSDSSTITITALNASNAIVAGATIQLSANTGILVPGTVTTDTAGKATVDFSSGTQDASSRTATISATANGKTSEIPIRISGSTITLATTSTVLSDNGSSPATITITAMDAGGNRVANTPVTLTQSGGGAVNLSPSSGSTDANGELKVTVSGTRAPAVTVTASALGETRTQDFSITQSAGSTSFFVDQQILNGTVISNNDITAMKIGDSLQIRVNAPNSTQVTFATTLGVFNGTAAVTTPSIPVVAGKATATLTSTSAGIATVQVFDPANPSSNTDTLTVAVTSSPANAASITIQAAPIAIPISSGGTNSSSKIIASVKDVNGNPVGGAAVSFSIVSGTGTGGGETISPVVAITATDTNGGLSLGQAKATFTAGSLPSGAGGVKVHATVVGVSPVVETALDASITIGGTPTSVSIGQPSAFNEDSSKSQYIFPMSIFVTDSSGRGVEGVPVSVSLFPIAWSTGGPCSFDSDNSLLGRGTFFSEDINEDFIKDGGEDGLRRFYANGALVAGGTVDEKLTPASADAGTLTFPNGINTDANGILTVVLIYPKSSAFHLIDRVRASVIVQGSETVGELKFRLPALKIDVDPDCLLPTSPYKF